MAATPIKIPNWSDNALATLLQLGRRARGGATLAELRFMLVNETHALAPYRQAALWTAKEGVVALSGVVSPEANAPYVLWLERWFKAFTGDQIFTQDLATGSGSDPDWSDWLPRHTATLPIPQSLEFSGARLLLAREEPFDEGELALLEEWCAIWAAAAASRQPRGPLNRLFSGSVNGLSSKVLPIVLLVGVVAASLLPVHLTVLAPAELIPLQPSYVRAPLDGVVERVLVQPNQRVKAGDALFEFDRVSLSSRLQVAQRALATAQAEYRQKAQRALFDPDSKSQLAVLQSQVDEKAVEVNYLRALNERGVATAPRDGVVLFDDPSQWAGKPVVTGERIMMVADEKQVQIEAWLGPADRIELAPGAAVTLYLASDPVHPVAARLSYIAHEAQLRPEGLYAYRVRAALRDSHIERAQVGMKGTAKLEGPSVTLAYWVMRRPWAALRGWMGV